MHIDRDLTAPFALDGNFANLSTSVEPLQQQAQLATELTNDEAKRIADAQDAVVVAQVKAAQGMGGYPDLDTNVQAFGVSDGILKGLAAGAGNFMKVRAYNQQQKQLQQAYGVYADSQRAQMAQLQAQADARAAREQSGMGLMAPQMQPFYAAMDSAGRTQLLKEQGARVAAPLEGEAQGLKARAAAPYEGEAEGIKAKASAQGKGEAKAAEAIAERSGVLKHAMASGYGPAQLEVGGVPQIGRVNSYRYMTGQNPTTSLDLTREELANRNADVQYRAGALKLGALPGQLQREAAKDQLGIMHAQVEARYGDALKQIDLLTGENKLKEAETAKQKLLTYRPLYDQAIAKYEGMTPGQVKLFNSQMKSQNLPYELPEKPEAKYSPVKHDGRVTGWTDTQGHVYDKNRKLKN